MQFEQNLSDALFDVQSSSLSTGLFVLSSRKGENEEEKKNARNQPWRNPKRRENARWIVVRASSSIWQLEISFLKFMQIKTIRFVGFFFDSTDVRSRRFVLSSDSSLCKDLRRFRRVGRWISRRSRWFSNVLWRIVCSRIISTDLTTTKIRENEQRKTSFRFCRFSDRRTLKFGFVVELVTISSSCSEDSFSSSVPSSSLKEKQNWTKRKNDRRTWISFGRGKLGSRAFRGFHRFRPNRNNFLKTKRISVREKFSSFFSSTVEIEDFQRVQIPNGSS